MPSASPQVERKQAPLVAPIMDEFQEGHKTLATIYIDACKANGCKPNSRLVKMFSSQAMAENSLQEIDLNLNFVGRIGFRAILKVVKYKN